MAYKTLKDVYMHNDIQTFFVFSGLKTQGFMCVKQMLHHWATAPNSPFLFAAYVVE